MKRAKLTFLFYLVVGLNNLYSQGIRDPNPEKVTISDFSVKGNKSVCFWLRSVFSYPYKLPYLYVGAKDKWFSLKNETYMRILLNKKDTSCRFFAIHKFYKSIPEITAVNCFYQDNNKIASENKIDPGSVFIINYLDKGCFFDLTALKDSTRNVIVDIKFTYPIISKKEINFYTDEKLDYKFLYIRMDIPEIYKYNIDIDDSLLTEKAHKPIRGPVIGYGPQEFAFSQVRRATRNKYIIVSKYNADKNSSLQTTLSDGRPGPVLKANYPPVFCYVNPYIFRSKKPKTSEIENIDDDFPSIIKFDLSQINEIDMYVTKW